MTYRIFAKLPFKVPQGPKLYDQFPCDTLEEATAKAEELAKRYDSGFVFDETTLRAVAHWRR